jgi:transposase
MPKVSRVQPHHTTEEIDKIIKNTVGFWRVKRLLVIRHAQECPQSAQKIGDHIGFAKQTVNQLISAYNKYGLAGIEAKGRGQRQKAYLTIEEEQAFLAPFMEKASRGELCTIKDIQEVYKETFGISVHRTTIQRLLKRHGWRKVVPRPVHAKQDAMAQEEFKKKLPSTPSNGTRNKTKR